MSKKPHVDKLTGLPGHDDCIKKLEAVLKGSRPVALALADLDCFGQFNDSCGAGEGDALIRTWTRHLRTGLSDGAELYRFGGDALMAVWPDTEKERAFLAIETARESFASGTKGTSNDPPTFSGGVAASPDDGDDADTLVRKCSEALYRAKLGGRNKVCLSREEKMVTKTVHYRQGQLEGLTRLAKRESMNEASLLREALDDLLRKYNA